ncbi:unnamed protein product [Amaranthus hypochondriacus]
MEFYKRRNKDKLGNVIPSKTEKKCADFEEEIEKEREMGCKDIEKINPKNESEDPKKTGIVIDDEELLKEDDITHENVSRFWFEVNSVKKEDDDGGSTSRRQRNSKAPILVKKLKKIQFSSVVFPPKFLCPFLIVFVLPFDLLVVALYV